ncbi:hypothetical protein [Acidithiobacillus sp.]
MYKMQKMPQTAEIAIMGRAKAVLEYFRLDLKILRVVFRQPPKDIHSLLMDKLVMGSK